MPDPGASGDAAATYLSVALGHVAGDWIQAMCTTIPMYKNSLGKTMFEALPDDVMAIAVTIHFITYPNKWSTSSEYSLLCKKAGYISLAMTAFTSSAACWNSVTGGGPGRLPS